MLRSLSLPISPGRVLRVIRQLLRFGVVGSAVAVFDFVTYFSLTRLVRPFRRHYLATSVTTATIGAILSYFVNSGWTFRQRERDRSLKQFVGYVTIYVGGIFWQNVLLWVAVERFHLHDLISKILAILVVALCWNFLLSKLLVFGRGH